MAESGFGKGQNHEEFRKFHQDWEAEQQALRELVIDQDAEPWILHEGQKGVPLRYIAGVDLSFVKEDPDVACAAIVIVEFPSLELKFESYRIVKLDLPYISGFLAFRECPHLLELINDLRKTRPDLTPQILMVDGMGVLHPRGLGLASHLGVLTGIPTIGVGKTFLNVDGLKKDLVVRESRQHLHAAGDAWCLKGESGRILGAAFRSTDDAPNPVFVSRGHLITLETALDVVRVCCRYRVPEPIRLADKGSREYLRVHYHPQAPVATSEQESHFATAMQLHVDKWVVALHRVSFGTSTVGRMAIHFCLDNSGSMGSNSNVAINCFSELVALANEPCSLTVFSEKGQTLATDIHTPEELRALRLPQQGMTNISDGVSCMLKVVKTRKVDTQIHHVMVLLTDGGHNQGEAPSVVFPKLAAMMQKEMPGIKTSMLVIGITNASRTDMGMLAKTSLETVPLPGMRPIYFCQQATEMQSVLDELKSGLLNHLGGKVVHLSCPKVKFCASLSSAMASDCDVFVSPSLSKAGAALFAEVSDPASLHSLQVDGKDTPTRIMDFDEEVAMQAMEVLIRLMRQQKVAHGNVTHEKGALEPWLRAFEVKLGGTEPMSQTEFAHLTPHERLRLHKTIATRLCKLRELRNEVTAIEAMQADNSAAQAEFLTGKSCKYAAKALQRAAPKHTLDGIVQDLQARLPKLKVALRKDAFLLLKKVKDTSQLFEEVGEFEPLLEELLGMQELVEEGLRSELAAFIDNHLISLLRHTVPMPESYLSLHSQWEQLREWVDALEGGIEGMVTTEYELLMSLGMLGLPLKISRSNATQMDPFQCRVTSLLAAPCDSGSLFFALKSGVEILSPEGEIVEDILVSIDPLCPNASAVMYWSKLVDTLYSVALCRDLFMYSGPTQRIALHAHAFCAAAAQAQHEVFAARALQILYSVRRHWGDHGAEPYRALATRLLQWETITESDDVDHPVQILIALAATDWEDWPPLQPPALAILFNEILSRRARIKLRGMTSNHTETSAAAHTLMRKAFGITDGSCPEPTPPEERELSLEEIRDACSCDYALDPMAFDIPQFLEDTLRPTIATVVFIQALQAYLGANGRWNALMAAIEEDGAVDAVHAITNACQQPQPVTPVHMLDVEERRVTAVEATMALQAFLHHVSAQRHNLGDPSDGETLRELVKDLRMDVYLSRLCQKNAARKAIIGSLTYDRAMEVDDADFETMIGTHAHGLTRREFWAIALAAKQTPGTKRDIFLKKCNPPFSSGKQFRRL